MIMFNRLAVTSWFSGSSRQRNAPAAAATTAANIVPPIPWPNQFQYAGQLNSNKNEIRLLLLEPALNENQPLRAHLKVVSLDGDASNPNLPAYTALSYTWGSPFEPRSDFYDPQSIDQVHSLLIQADDDGQEELQLGISDSLFDALRHIRPVTGQLAMWVDAICINQANNAEKSAQVSRMRHIYACAETVLVWLGPETAYSDMAIEALTAQRRFARRIAAYQEPSKEPSNIRIDMRKVPPPRSPQESQDEAVILGLGRLFGIEEDNGGREIPEFPISAVDALLRRAWWGRVWVLQELAVARRVVFACGRARIGGRKGRFGSTDLEDTETEDASLAITTFLQTWDRFTFNYGRQPVLMDHRPWTMIETRMRIQMVDERPTTERSDDGPQPLKWLLQESAAASLRASNPLDYVFALLGLASDADELGIGIDYAVDQRTLYTALALAYIKQGDLWFLSYCEIDRYRRVADELPSWVPDWSSPHGIKPLGAEHFAASGHMTASADVQRVHNMGLRLSVKGILLDTVVDVAPPRPNISQNNRDRIANFSVALWVCTAHQQLVQLPTDRTGSAVFTGLSAESRAFCWTLLCDQIASPAEDRDLPNHQRLENVEAAFQFLVDSHLIGQPLPGEPSVPGQRPKRILPQVPAAAEASLSQSQSRSAWLGQRADCYMHCMMSATVKRLVFRTAGGHFGLCSSQFVQPGDRVAVFSGHSVPMVLRMVPSWAGVWYRLVSETYLSDMMDGQAWKKGFPVESIVLE